MFLRHLTRTLLPAVVEAPIDQADIDIGIVRVRYEDPCKRDPRDRERSEKPLNTTKLLPSRLLFSALTHTPKSYDHIKGLKYYIIPNSSWTQSNP